MSDIVERLRQEADDIEVEPTECLWWEAADEIERLRRDLSDSSAEIVMNHEEIERLRLENENLKAAIAQVRDAIAGWGPTCGEADDE
jgi:hypothetical protein